ncbi:DUF2075 domain-containing protein [Pseudomonas putida]|uniref:DNA/RNA helicase domain-containing protein n=1 Tax=Pseudomonas putida TaxID=303 RepID=UPI0034D406B1
MRAFADAQGAQVEEHTLASQFCCNGSGSYLTWLDDVLQVCPTDKRYLDISLYECTVFNTTEELNSQTLKPAP